MRAFTSGLRAPEPAQHGGLGVEHGPLGAGLIALRICSKLINIIPVNLVSADFFGFANKLLVAPAAKF